MSRRTYQIGFNKTATVSLHVFFLRNNIPSVHWDRGRLAKTVFDNLANGRPLFTHYKAYSAFTDMEHRDEHRQIRNASEALFKKMHAQDSQDLFIFNTRSLKAWLRSRAQQDDYLEGAMRAHGLSTKEVLTMWTAQYNSHCEAVRDYFGDIPHLLDFNIERDNGTTLSAFLAQHGIETDPKFYGHNHRTIRMQNREQRNQQIHNLRDAAIDFPEVEGEVALRLKLMGQAIELRPIGAFMQRKAAGWRACLKQEATTQLKEVLRACAMPLLQCPTLDKVA
jgi:hypothetical protein